MRLNPMRYCVQLTKEFQNIGNDIKRFSMMIYYFNCYFFIFFFELVKRFDDLWPFVFKFSGNCLKSLLMNRLRCLFLMQLNQTKVMMNHSKRRLNLKNSNSNRIVLYIKQGETQSILSSFRINLKNVLKEKKKQIQNVMFS